MEQEDTTIDVPRSMLDEEHRERKKCKNARQVARVSIQDSEQRRCTATVLLWSFWVIRMC
jgi:hypothetical protein